MAGGFERLCNRILSDWRLLAPLILANLAGMVFGWYYYWDVGQFDPSSQYYQDPLWWPLVADSPNAVALFFAAALIRKLARRRWPLLDALAFTLNIYVGLWTTLLFLGFAQEMGTFRWGSTNSILFVTHMGMPAQALLLAPDLLRDGARWNRWASATLGAFLALFVYVDYWGPMLHPAPFLHPSDQLLHTWSPWLMVVAFVAFLLVKHVQAKARPTPSVPSAAPT